MVILPVRKAQHRHGRRKMNPLVPGVSIKPVGQKRPVPAAKRFGKGIGYRNARLLGQFMNQ